MKIHTLGTSAGTQPFPGFHHTSTAIETGKGLYFIDTGECCAYTAHVNGVDLMKTKAVFLTHPHMDHVGGLANLLWYIRKLGFVRKQPLTKDDSIYIYTPCRATVDGVMKLLENTEGHFSVEHSHVICDTDENMCFDNGDVRVTACHTDHMPPENGRYTSFSYTVEAEGKTVVFSGDTRLEDYERTVPGKCDALFVETGHHQIEDVCGALKKYNKRIGKLFFTHNGGYIMQDPAAAEERVKKAFGGSFAVCRDGDSFTL